MNGKLREKKIPAPTNFRRNRTPAGKKPQHIHVYIGGTEHDSIHEFTLVGCTGNCKRSGLGSLFPPSTCSEKSKVEKLLKKYQHCF